MARTASSMQSISSALPSNAHMQAVRTMYVNQLLSLTAPATLTWPCSDQKPRCSCRHSTRGRRAAMVRLAAGLGRGSHASPAAETKVIKDDYRKQEGARKVVRTPRHQLCDTGCWCSLNLALGF